MQISIQVNATAPRWLRNRTRRKVAVLGLAAALLIPGLALASHQFTDVPDSNTFHGNISKVYGARITAGCTATTYCPTTAVTREQMAAFLARSAGRVAVSTVTTMAVPATTTEIDTISIKAGDVAGGTAYVKLDLAMQTFALTAGCPCDGFFYIYQDGIQRGLAYYSLGLLSSDSFTLDSSALTAVVSVPTGVTSTFSIRATKAGGTANVSTFGNTTATYLPFGALGGNAPANVVAGGGPGKDVPGGK